MSVLEQPIASGTAFFPRFPPEELAQASPWLLVWFDRQRQRARLAQLEDGHLDDIRVSRAEAIMEGRRWD